MSLHILDIVENSLNAGAGEVFIRVSEDILKDLFSIEIKDNGRGMDAETVKMVYDPFYTTRTTRRVGLGIPLLAQSAKECGGSVAIVSRETIGTAVTATFRRSHIDRKPLGDVGATMTVLIASHPEKDFIFEYQNNGYNYCLDTKEIKKGLGDVPINRPDVLKLIKEDIIEGVRPAYE